LTIGYQYSYGQFVITNGGTVVDSTGSIGDLNGGSDSHDNSVLVTGSGSVWSNVVLYVGNYGSHNRLRIEDGGKVVSPYGYIGYGNHANQAIVTGNGSAWDIGQRLNIGDGGTSNELYVTSYGRVAVDGPVQFAWSDYAGRIVVSNSSTLTCRSLQIGSYSPYATGTLTVEGGVFAATNQTANGLTWIRRGGVIINSGTALFDIVAVTNGSWCVLKFNGGFIDAKATIVSNSLQFAVGDGNHSATFHLSGGTHNFANGIAISTNALLTGCGTIVGTVVNRGRIAISCPGGALSFGGALTNDGTIIAHDVATLDFFGPVVNNGVIDTFGGSAYFHAGFINNGTIVDASSFRITTIAQEGADIRVTWTTVGGTTNFVQATEDPCSNFDDISSVIVASGTGLTSTDYLDAGAATNFPSRFYRIRIVP
jgi:T5SS/PEP-CTERM-associated repeat protein